jgi:hypothetical protein
MASLAELRKEWSSCLGKFGSVGRCEKLEKDLRGRAKAEGVDCCVDETIALIRCTTGSGRGEGCGAAFLAMRECNRAGGKHLVADGGVQAIAPGKMNLFTADAASLTSSTPPTRTLQGMTSAGEELASSLRIPAGGVAF